MTTKASGELPPPAASPSLFFSSSSNLTASANIISDINGGLTLQQHQRKQSNLGNVSKELLSKGITS
jgi:hypothetical protein